MEIENGKIESTNLGPEDHGILTFWLSLAFDGGGQGFGGYDIWALPCQVLGKLLQVLEVKSWEDLKNTYIRVKRDEPFGKIIAIGHIVKDKWFTCRELTGEAKK